MLAEIKMALRISTDAFDAEISSLIEAAELDLQNSGIAIQDTPDALYIEAVKRFVKMNFGEPDEYDRTRQSYELLKAHLAIASGYSSNMEVV